MHIMHLITTSRSQLRVACARLTTVLPAPQQSKCMKRTGPKPAAAAACALVLPRFLGLPQAQREPQLAAAGEWSLNRLESVSGLPSVVVCDEKAARLPQPTGSPTEAEALPRVQQRDGALGGVLRQQRIAHLHGTQGAGW